MILGVSRFLKEDRVFSKSDQPAALKRLKRRQTALQWLKYDDRRRGWGISAQVFGIEQKG